MNYSKKIIATLFIIGGIISFISLYSCSENPSSSTTKMESSQKEILLYVGTYTKKEGHVDGKADGIYVLKMNTKTGKLTPVDTIKNIINPSYIAIHPNQNFLYSVVELADNSEQNVGMISAFNIENLKEVKFLNSVSSEGDAPCHINVDPTGKYVVVANYVTGNAASYPILEEGQLGKAISIVQETRTTPELFRQEASHLHMVYTNIDDGMLVPDLGTDKTVHFRIEPDGQLKRVAETSTIVQSGPRHLDFHPNKKWCYILNELNQTIDFFEYSGIDQAMNHRKTISTIETLSEVGHVFCGAIHMHPSGHFLYATNRGVGGNKEQSITSFQIDQNSGILTRQEIKTLEGEIARDFAIDPSGHFLLVALQDSDLIITYKINQETGALIETGIKEKVMTPVCLKFVK